MKQPQRPQRKSWWKSKVTRLIIAASGAVLMAIPFTSFFGFFGLFLVVTGASYLLIRIMIPSEKRTFPYFVWETCTMSFFCAVLFFESATIRVAGGDLDWFGNFLFGSILGRLISSLVLGILLGAPLIILPMLLRAYTGAVWVLALNEIYGITAWQAFCLTVCLILKINRQIIRVEEGQVKEIKPQGWPLLVGGPALAIIRPYNAVVFEKADRVTRVEGPGTVLMDFEERIKTVIDLRRQGMPVEANQVLTRERVPLRVQGGVGFRVQTLEERIAIDAKARAQLRDLDRVSFLAAGPNSEQGELDRTRVLRQSVYDVTYNTRLNQKWIERVQGDLESEIRKVFRTYNFSEIYNLDDRRPTVRATILEEITQRINEGVKNSAQQYGVFVFGISIKTIQPDQVDNLNIAYFDALIAEWRRRAQLTQARADRETLTKRATAQSRIVVEQIGAVVQQFSTALAGINGSGQQQIPTEVINRFLQLSSRLLENVITDQSAARQYLDTMESLAQISPTTIIAAGMDMSQVTNMLAAGIKPPD